MKIKIEFEIEDTESAELIGQLQRMVAQAPTPVMNTLLNEISKDINVSGKVALRFMMWLRNYTTKPVDMEKEFQYHLGFALWWLQSENGLAKLCNITLSEVKALYGGECENVKAKDLKDVKKVKDAIEVILTKYNV